MITLGLVKGLHKSSSSSPIPSHQAQGSGLGRKVCTQILESAMH